MRIVVDRVLCEGNARCVRAAPALFRVDEDDRLHVLVERPTDDQRAAAEQAVAVCPRQALTLIDD